MRSLVLLFALLAAAPAWAQVELVDAFPGVSFNAPLEVALAPGQTDRYYIIEQRGVIRTLAEGDAATTTFLDINPLVAGGGEKGLLGIAFHPDYETNGRFFVHYSSNNPHRSIIAEYARSAADPLVADPESAVIRMEVSQPFSNHNGGKIAFGPDGYLYISLGDGGSGGDPGNRAQNPATLLGKLLRIDVDDIPDGATYGIPPDNPFAGSTGNERPEIFALGLRNVWKFTFDSETGAIWAADVGQSRWEEVSVVENGGNYGWKQVEGPECFVSGCDLSAFAPPIYAYPHSAGGVQSITGGYVYHGDGIPAIDGTYLYADLGSHGLHAVTFDLEAGTSSAERILAASTILSIDPDWSGEPLVLTFGNVQRLRQAGTATAPGAEAAALRVRLAGAHPASGDARIAVSAAPGGPVRVSLHDALGREVRVLHDGPLGTAASQTLAVGRHGLASGVYVVHAVSGDRAASLRLVIAR